jgi:hypothetical protein
MDHTADRIARDRRYPVFRNTAMRRVALVAFALVLPLVLGAQVHGQLGVQPTQLVAAQYTPATERGYCVTAWHVEHLAPRDTVVVVDSIRFAAQGTRTTVDYSCGSLPTLHTHPPELCAFDTSDFWKGIVKDELPFFAIACDGRTVFWIVGDRLHEGVEMATLSLAAAVTLSP